MDHNEPRPVSPARLAGCVAAAFLAGVAALGAWGGAAATPVQALDYVLSDVWPVDDGEPVAIAVRADGVSLVARIPWRPTAGFATLQRREADGTVSWQGAVPDTAGAELRPLAVAADERGDMLVSTDSQLVRLTADGRPVWEAPAGDGHADFGPAARGLAVAGDMLFGTDLANARVVGYSAATGARRLRLGTAGSSAGSYLAPLDVAIGPAGTLVVADYGNRRLQVLDAAGNPLWRWPLPARPRAVAVDAAGQTFVALETDEILVVDEQGAPLRRIGRPGRAAGELQMVVDLAVAPDGRLFVVDRGNRRIQVFRPVMDPPPGASPPPAATPTPSSGGPQRRSLWACPEAPGRLALPVELPPGPPRADVLMVFDTTGSMESVISTAQQRALDLAAQLTAGGGDVAWGVLDVRDYPYGRAGMPTDWPWFLRSSLSTDPNALRAATAELRAAGGGDAPEAYSGALLAALEDQRVGWRDGARRFIALFGDSVPRDRDLNERVAAPKVPGAWTPGVPGWWRDSGPDWAPGSADDLAWGSLLDRLKAERVTLLAGISGAAPEALRGVTADLVAYWAEWAAQTGAGGHAVDLTDVGRLPEALSGMVAAAGRRIDRLEVVVQPAVYGAWVIAVPAAFTALELPAGGSQRRFDLTVAPPPGTAPGVHRFLIEARGDGARYAAIEVELTWRPSCEVSPTPPPDTPTASATAPPTATPSPTASPSPTATVTPRPLRRLYLPLALRRYCPPASRPPADIVLVLDTSSSMAGAKLAAALQAASAFVTVVNLPRDHVALVTFNHQARLAAGLTGSRATLQIALASATTSEGTRIDLGLEAALAELAGPRARRGATPVIVLLTDGRPNVGTIAAVLDAAARARAARVTVFTIGLGGDVDGDLLGRVATDPSGYTFAPDLGALVDIYRRIAEGIPCQ
jgi:uncharacterized protein YegL